MTFESASFIIGLGTLGPGIAIGLIGAAALLAMARNPQNAERIQLTMFVAFAFAEAIAIYGLVMALIIHFV